MKTIKEVSKAFNILSIVIRIISMFVILFAWKKITKFPILALIMCFVDIAIAVSAISSIDTNKKSIGMGVVDLLFSSLVGGILYLCWNPEKSIYSNTSKSRHCPICGQEIFKDSPNTYCANCRKKLNDLTISRIKESEKWECAICGFKNNPNATRCIECGNEKQVKEHSANTNANDNNTIYCRYCGHKIPADALFCTYCGKNQSENNN